MTLEGTVQRNDEVLAVNLLAEAMKIPIEESIVNFEKAINQRRRRLLIGIVNISKTDVVATVDAFGNEST